MNKQVFNGKVAVVTGSSRGIGKAVALELARRGASVVLNGRNPERLEAADKEIRNLQENLLSVCCDVSTSEGGRHLIDETIKHFGKIDILVCNVGVSMRGNFADLNPGVFRMMFESNLKRFDKQNDGRRERDSNPRSRFTGQRFSRPPQSTTLPSLPKRNKSRIFLQSLKRNYGEVSPGCGCAVRNGYDASSV